MRPNISWPNQERSNGAACLSWQRAVLPTTTSMPRTPDVAAPVPDASRGVERAYREHGAYVLQVAVRLGRGDRAWAEDMTHEVFMELHDRWGSIRDVERIPGWLYRATVHRCLNRLRRDRLLGRPWVRWLVAGWHPARPDPERVSLGRAELDELFARVAALPDKQRVVFCMRHFDERSGREVAEVLGHSEGYVSKLLARAEAALQPSVEGEPCTDP